MIFRRQAVVSLTVIGALSLSDITIARATVTSNMLRQNNAVSLAGHVGNRANSNAKNGGLRRNGRKNNNHGRDNKNRMLSKGSKGSKGSVIRVNTSKGGKSSKGESVERAGPIERDPIILGVDGTAEDVGAVIPTPKPDVVIEQIAETNTDTDTLSPTTDEPASLSPTVSSTETPTAAERYTDEPTAEAPTLSPAVDISSSISDFIGGDDEATTDSIIDDTASETPTVSPTELEVETKIATEDDESMVLPLEIVEENEEEGNEAGEDAEAIGSENFYEDYLPEDSVSVTSAPTTSPTTASPTHTPTNANSDPPSPKPTNAPIVPPPTALPTEHVDIPENACFEENGVSVCVTYFDDYSCEMQVDDVACECCFYDPQYKFISTFDCTNIGDEWGSMGLCTPGTFPSDDAEEEGGNDGVGEAALSLDFGSDGDVVGADNISLGTRERRGRRTRAQVLRRKTKTKRRRESVVE